MKNERLIDFEDEDEPGPKKKRHHESSRANTTTWLTPKWVIDALGGASSFDLDPCAAPAPRPWDTARRMNSFADGDGLDLEWAGRVWLNPPYSGHEIGKWMRRLADHGRGTAMIFARTETKFFRAHVWERATLLLFVYGRVRFAKPDGNTDDGTAGAPSVIIAYGQDDADRLLQSGIEGTYLRLAPTRTSAGPLFEQVPGLPCRAEAG